MLDFCAKGLATQGKQPHTLEAWEGDEGFFNNSSGVGPSQQLELMGESYENRYQKRV
jgi:hypothetical protein